MERVKIIMRKQKEKELVNAFIVDYDALNVDCDYRKLKEHAMIRSEESTPIRKLHLEGLQSDCHIWGL